MTVAEWYVMYVRTGREEYAAERLNAYLPDMPAADGCRVFVPKKDWPYIKGGEVIRIEMRICFPGYVFVKSWMDKDVFIRELYPAMTSPSEVYRFLCYDAGQKDIAMRDEERVYMERLLDENFKADASYGFIEGGKARVISGALKGLEGNIVKIYRNKRKAVVSLPMMGEAREISVMLQLLAPQDIKRGT
jgi:transcriptional antiterminator NusG